MRFGDDWLEEEIKRQEQKRLDREKQEKERKEEAKQNPTPVVLIDLFARRITKRKKPSPSAVRQANRKAALSEDEKKRLREKDKIRQREKRKEESIYETTDDQKQAGASRMASSKRKVCGRWNNEKRQVQAEKWYRKINKSQPLDVNAILLSWWSVSHLSDI